MAVFTRRTILVLIGLIILVTLALRYPLVEHERMSTDSYFIHNVSQSVIDNGYAKWTFSPLSYFGYYPFSYPSGVPILIASLSQMTGLNIESSILLADLAISVAFALIVFGLAREFVPRTEYAVLAALFISIGPRFVETTYWNGSARGLEVVLMTMLVFVTLRAAFMQKNRLLACGVLVGFGCFATHHMAVLILLYGFGFLIAAGGVHLLPRFFSTRRNRLAVAVMLGLGFVAVLSALANYGLLGGTVAGFEDGIIQIQPAGLTIIANLLVSYGQQVGLILILALVGILSVFRSTRLTMKSLLPVTILLAFVPIVGSSLYVSMLVAPFFAILGVRWIGTSRKQIRPKWLWSIGLILVLALSIGTPFVSIERWNHTAYSTGDTEIVGPQVMNDASYIRWGYSGRYAVSNGDVLQAEIEGPSRISFLRSGIGAALSGDIVAQDVHRNVSFSRDPFPKNLYVWLQYPDEHFADNYVAELMRVGTVQVTASGTGSTIADYSKAHENLLVVTDNNWPTQYAISYGTMPSTFMNEVWNSETRTYEGVPQNYHDQFQSYLIYESSRTSLFAVHLPVAPS